MRVRINLLRREDLPEGSNEDDLMDAYGAAAAKYLGVTYEDRSRAFERLPWGDHELSYFEAEGDWSDVFDYGLWASSPAATAHVVAALLPRMKVGIVIGIDQGEVSVDRGDGLPSGTVVIASDRGSIELERPTPDQMLMMIGEATGDLESG